MMGGQQLRPQQFGLFQKDKHSGGEREVALFRQEFKW